jgi:TetR/AcrR family transcriptional regulator
MIARMDTRLPPQPSADPTPLAAATDSPPAGRRGRARSEAEILAVAEEVFATYGLHGATTAKIAERAGIPKANIHYYFSTKEALYLRVLKDILEEWLSAAAFDAHDSARPALESYIRAKLHYSRVRPQASKVWANEILNGAPLIRKHLEDRLLAWVDAKASIIQGWIDRGELAPVDPRHLLFTIWATTQHYSDFATQITILLRKEALEDADFEQAAQLLTQMVLGGLAKPL